MGAGMRLYFLLVRRVPPVPSPVLVEAFERLEQRGFEVEGGIAEELVDRVDTLEPEHDVYVLKSHTELSLSVAGALHARGARLLNPYESCVAAQNKIVAARRLRAARVPVPRSWVTGDLTLLRPIAARTPLIVKPYLGHRGLGINVVRTPEDLERVPPPDNAVIVQEYIEGDGEDLKLYVVGDEVFGVRKPFSATSFTVPGRPCRVSPEARRVALRVGRALGLGLYGLDVIEGRDGPVVVDVNYFPGYKGVPDAATYIASYIESYALGEIWLEPPKAPQPAGAAVEVGA
jgi:ribosomal protein S6--L-glutamate ligase